MKPRGLSEFDFLIELRITLKLSIVRFYTQQRRRHIVRLWNVVRNRAEMTGKKLLNDSYIADDDLG